MNHDDYFKKLQQLEGCNTANLIALGTWTRNDALPWLWTEMAGAILTPKQKHPNATTAPAPRKLTPMSDADAVRQGLMISVSDRITRARDPAFYRAQLTMLDKEATRYCNVIDSFSQAISQGAPIFSENATVDTLHRALREMMRYALILLEDAASGVTDVPGYFGAWRRRHETPFEVFKGTEQIIYGTYSGMTHTDRAPYIPVAVLRTAIELRLRDAFCVSSYVNPSKPEELIPIDLSKLFDAIQTRQKDIDFAVDLHDVWKIYRWSNFYLHSGVRDFPWVPGFLLQYLRPLFGGRDIGENGAWSIHGGIQMKRETWHAVREALRPRFERIGLIERFSNAWRALCPGKKSLLELPPVDEKAAECVFLD
ncbi:Uncharacterised protein [Burkholderia pseudomallei]|uniref:hypothetical protein n=1 Tax=Burkholderia pseudomallei TaxID=28450 RepID=UPI000F23E484|nr:hypothetical protein [Burkholderia pseudomallei]VBT33943.1 Uncharacterised protein [Burkholderia pseudomallei]